MNLGRLRIVAMGLGLGLGLTISPLTAEGRVIRVEPADGAAPGDMMITGGSNCTQSVIDEIEYRLCIPGTTFEFGNTVEMIYTVTNLGTEPHTFNFSSSCQEHFYVSDLDCNESECDVVWWRDLSCFGVQTEFTLEPNDSRILEFPYRLHTDDGYRLVAGQYRAWSHLLEHPKSKLSVAFDLVPYGPAPLQAAIDLAEIGDTVLVAPGIYYENINFLEKEIVLLSESGPEFTILDAGGRGSALYLDRTSVGAVVEGFTIRHGYENHVGDGEEHFLGGGISLLATTAPLIRGNIFRDNVSDHGGGIATNYRCSADIYDNLFFDNSAFEGGGAFVWADSPEFRGNTFVNNQAEYGGGIFDQGLLGQTRLHENIFYANSAGSSAGAIHCANSTVVSCNAFWLNSPDDMIDCINPSLSVFADPLFCDPFSERFHLRADSPCTAENSPCETQIGAFGVDCTPASVPETLSGLATLRIFPNPSRGEVTFEFQQVSDDAFAGERTLHLFDMNGRRLRTWTADVEQTHWQWDGRLGEHEAPSGIYLVELRVGDRPAARQSLLRLR